jgi:hypothetical protein
MSVLQSVFRIRILGGLGKRREADSCRRSMRQWRPNNVVDLPSLRQLPSVLYSRKLVEAGATLH